MSGYCRKSHCSAQVLSLVKCIRALYDDLIYLHFFGQKLLTIGGKSRNSI